jgi:hypothetical protein
LPAGIAVSVDAGAGRCYASRATCRRVRSGAARAPAAAQAVFLGAAYPHLTGDNFVTTHRDEWLKD